MPLIIYIPMLLIAFGFLIYAEITEAKAAKERDQIIDRYVDGTL